MASMQKRTLIIALDLGTSTTTACFVIARHLFDAEGKPHRELCGNVCDVRDWPGSHQGDAIGNICVPTDLVYDKATGQLLFWGFDAERYLNEPFPEPHLDQVFVVEHIKLLLPDPDEAKVTTPASARYRKMRDELSATLGKHPNKVFEDFMTKVVGHVIESAKRRYNNGIHSCEVELVLAFPSGWPDYIHTTVAGIGAKAMSKAISKGHLQNMTFGIENVYTVSETLSGVKEWLRDSIAEATVSVDLDQPTVINLNELNEGDCFLPVDIGGGTGCMTPLKLVTKAPLRVDQLGPTQSLEVSGEAVQAEFEKWLTPRITKKDFPRDIPLLIYQICRKFKEEKKHCGQPLRPGCSTWNLPVSRLRSNPSKGFEKDCMKIDRKYLDRCFDPVIDTLEAAINQILCSIPDIKVIVFLGQFGGSSVYLQQRMAKSSIRHLVKLRYSQSGKLNVVKGAMAERSSLSSNFVRKFETLKSYGALVTMPYYPGSQAEKIFPNPHQQGAVPFERGTDGLWLKLIEWAIPKNTTVEKGHTRDIGRDGPRHHTWPYSDEVIEFEDTIIISDEVPPLPQHEGKSLTLWTEAREKNQLIEDNKRLRVQQIPFSWDLTMSQKISPAGVLLGSYGRDDLETYMFPEVKRKGKRRERLRKLDYELVWEITEMQVKVHVRAHFPNQIGPITTQLAKERRLEEHERTLTGESRSKALIRDIDITTTAGGGPRADGVNALDDDRRRGLLVDNSGPSGLQQRDGVAREYQQIGRTESPRMTSLVGAGSQLMSQSVNDSEPAPSRNTLQPAEASSSNIFRSDGRRRNGCYTCKDRKKKCDCSYTFDETRGSQSCNECIRHAIPCYVTEPEWAKDSSQVMAQQLERKRMVKLGKRKARDESESSNTVARGRSMTTNASDFSWH